jgi:hypothetical protein
MTVCTRCGKRLVWAATWSGGREGWALAPEERPETPGPVQGFTCETQPNGFRVKHAVDTVDVGDISSVEAFLDA